VATSDYLAAAEQHAVDLTVVGPEAPLVAGVVDQFRAAKRPIVGPTKANAQLEGSKIFAKKFMEDVGIPTARAERVTSVEEAKAALARFPMPVVIKADGLMAGKGVVIARTRAEAEAAVEALGPALIVEEFLEGEEVSFIVLADGRDVVAFEATQDHKAVWDDDRGPNTGGMGAYCDGRILDSATADSVLRDVIHPAVERTKFTGFLYAGLMMTADGPRVLEFNVRLGDPETQPLMHRLDCDFAETLWAAARGELAGKSLRWKAEPSVCVVLAAEGYPGKVRTGDMIGGIDSAGAVVFQAGTRRTERGLETAGGRVLGVTQSGGDLAAAIQAAYEAVGRVHFEGMHYRRDIGRKGLKRW
jgi:phosphoribosylamine--glycine ligase